MSSAKSRRRRRRGRNRRHATRRGRTLGDFHHRQRSDGRFAARPSASRCTTDDASPPLLTIGISRCYTHAHTRFPVRNELTPPGFPTIQCPFNTCDTFKPPFSAILQIFSSAEGCGCLAEFTFWQRSIYGSLRGIRGILEVSCGPLRS